VIAKASALDMDAVRAQIGNKEGAQPSPQDGAAPAA